jgi:hypothetical protein
VPTISGIDFHLAQSLDHIQVRPEKLQLTFLVTHQNDMAISITGLSLPRSTKNDTYIL